MINRSIRQRLERAKTKEIKLEILKSWTDSFQRDVNSIIKELELLSKRTDDRDQLVNIEKIIASTKKIASRRVNVLEQLFVTAIQQSDNKIENKVPGHKA